MTREERVARLVELRKEVEAQAAEYNEAMLNNNYGRMKELDDETVKKVNEYTATVRNMLFDECKESENPMLTAVTKMSFVTIGVRDKKNEDGAFVRCVEEKARDIDLLQLHKYCNGIGANQQWKFIAQKMNFLLTVQTCEDLGVSPKSVNDSYLMSDIAKQIDMGKTPTSKTNLLKTLQQVITAMLGEEYKATSHDVNFLLKIYAKKGRSALAVVCANHTHFVKYLAAICHHIVTGAAYDVIYKAKRN